MKTETAERLLELVFSKVSESERRATPSLLECERQMRDTLKEIFEIQKQTSENKESQNEY